MSHQIINVVIVLLNSFRLFPLIDTFFLNHVNTAIHFFLKKKNTSLHFSDYWNMGNWGGQLRKLTTLEYRWWNSIVAKVYEKKKNKEKKTHEDEYFLVQRELEIKMYYFNYTQKCVIKIEHNFYLLFFFFPIFKFENSNSNTNCCYCNFT